MWAWWGRRSSLARDCPRCHSRPARGPEHGMDIPPRGPRIHEAPEPSRAGAGADLLSRHATMGAISLRPCKKGTDGHLWFVGDESRLHDGFRFNGMGGPLHGVSVRISRALTKVCRDGHNGDDSKRKMPPAGSPGVEMSESKHSQFVR